MTDESPGLGHNSGAESDPSTKARLQSFIHRIERLEEEKSELAQDIREVYGEAKATGFDPKIMRKIIRLRKMDAEKRQEEMALIQTYSAAVGL